MNRFVSYCGRKAESARDWTRHQATRAVPTTAAVAAALVGTAASANEGVSITPPVDVAAYITAMVSSLGGVWIAIITGFVGFLVVSIALRKSKKIGSA
jgi:hypothetical protein